MACQLLWRVVNHPALSLAFPIQKGFANRRSDLAGLRVAQSNPTVPIFNQWG
jgi:hypothetical protein